MAGRAGDRRIRSIIPAHPRNRSTIPAILTTGMYRTPIKGYRVDRAAGHPNPIYHPGHPDHGLPPYPDQGLPGGGSGSSGGQPSHPIHLPGVPDQGLPEPEPVPPEGITDPELPEGYDDELVIAVKKAGGDDWDYYAYSVQPDQGQPTPTPQSAGRRGR